MWLVDVDSGQRGICQNPLLAPKWLKTVVPVNCPSKSSTIGRGQIHREHFHWVLRPALIMPV